MAAPDVRELLYSLQHRLLMRLPILQTGPAGGAAARAASAAKQAATEAMADAARGDCGALQFVPGLHVHHCSPDDMPTLKSQFPAPDMSLGDAAATSVFPMMLVVDRRLAHTRGRKYSCIGASLSY
jgi:hypothetical protein